LNYFIGNSTNWLLVCAYSSDGCPWCGALDEDSLHCFPLYCIVSWFISKTWLTKRSHLQDIEENYKILLLKSLQCTEV